MGLSMVETSNTNNQQQQDETKQESIIVKAVDDAMEFLKENENKDNHNNIATDEITAVDQFAYYGEDDFLPPQFHVDTYDPEAEHEHDFNYDPENVFKDLKRMLNESYHHYSAMAKKEGEKLPRKELSVTDIDLNKPCIRRETSMYELVDAWKTLIDKIIEMSVFLEYASHLERAFYQTASISANVHLVSRDVEVRRNILILVVLLERAVDQYAVDKSITCRFVTLLEVILSYCPGWQPSEEVTRFWMRIMQRIPLDIPPLNFRRRAYRVLVSLSWVPSSNGLLDACSFENMKQEIDFDKAEPCIKEHMERIRGRPLPRYDCVNQLLDRLKDETDVCVAITSKREGMGKTTLAAQVASHPSIRRVFTVLWLKVKNNETMTYERYKKYLNELYSQLPVKRQKHKVLWPKYIQRFEEPALRKIREKECIVQAREQMSDILQKLEKNVLLVLDDLTDSSFIEWFRFHDRQSVIVTTPDPDLEIVDWAVELSPMCEEEAIELFLKEADLPTDHVLGSTKELHHIITKAECNPLLVRTIARWYQLKQVTAGTIAAFQEIVEDLTSVIEGEQHKHDDDSIEPNQLLFDVLSLMMAPTNIQTSCMSPLFVLGFAAMIVVFDEVCPLDSVLLLWDQVLKIEPMASEEMTASTDEVRRRRGWFLAEGLSHMGLISVIEVNNSPWVHVHHQLYRQFAILMATQMELKESYEVSVADWNLAFVTAYFHKRIQCDKKDFDDNSWDYAIEKLATHMFKGKMVPTARTVLSEQTFFDARIEAMGWDKAIEQHIRDCISLQEETEKENPEADNASSASEIFNRSAEMIQDAADELPYSDTDITIKESRALYYIGVALTDRGYYTEAIEFFEEAQDLAPQSRSLRASILYSAGWALLANNDPDKAKKKINASRKIMDQGTDLHVLYKDMLQVYADALVATCDYKEAASFYEVMLENLRSEKENNPIELGTALYKKGRLNYIMGDLELARNTLDECIRWKTERNEISISLASAYGVLGDVMLELHNASEARKCLEAGLRTLDQLSCNAQQLHHKIMSAKLQFLRNDFEGSMNSFEAIRKKIAVSPQLVFDQSAYDLRMISRCYLLHGDVNSCVSMLREGLKLTADRPFALERVWTNIELGNVFVDESEFKEGLLCYEQALAIQIAMLGESMQIIDTSKLIGNVHLSLGDYNAALSIFSKAHEILQRVTPNNVDRIAGVLYLIGEAYDGKREYKEAGETYENCLKVLLKGRTKEHADIGKVHQLIGQTAAKLSNLDKALDNLSEAVRIMKMNFDEKLLAETIHSIGVIHRKRGEINAAKKSLQDALARRKSQFLNRESAETLLELANVYRMQHEPDNASKLLQKGLEILEDEDTYKGSLYLTLGHVKLAQSDFNGALEDYGFALHFRSRNYGNDHLLTANTCRSLGITLILLGETCKARDQLVEFVRVCDLQGESCQATLDYMLATVLLAHIHELNNNTEEASQMGIHVKKMLQNSESMCAKLSFFDKMLDRFLGGDGQSSGKLVLSSEELAEIQGLLYIDD